LIGKVTIDKMPGSPGIFFARQTGGFPALAKKIDRESEKPERSFDKGDFSPENVGKHTCAYQG